MKQSVEFREAEQVVIDSNLREAHVTGKIASVQNGTCHRGLPASLVVLEFVFSGKHPHSKSRIMKATIKIECVAIDGQNTNSSSLITHPEVERFCPGILNGRPIVTNVESRKEIAACVGTFSPLRYSKVHGWSEERYSTIEGQKSKSKPLRRRPQPSREHVECDSVEWALQEEEHQSIGILPRFRAALILKHAGPESQFGLNIALSVRTNFNKTLHVPWTSSLTPVSVTFRPTQLDKTQEIADFDTYDNEHWMRLVKYDEVYNEFTPLELFC